MKIIYIEAIGRLVLVLNIFESLPTLDTIVKVACFLAGIIVHFAIQNHFSLAAIAIQFGEVVQNTRRRRNSYWLDLTRPVHLVVLGAFGVH